MISNLVVVKLLKKFKKYKIKIYEFRTSKIYIEKLLE